MHQLPTEIQHHIFQHLELTNFLAVRATCRRCRSVADAQTSRWRTLDLYIRPLVQDHVAEHPGPHCAGWWEQEVSRFVFLCHQAPSRNLHLHLYCARSPPSSSFARDVATPLASIAQRVNRVTLYVPADPGVWLNLLVSFRLQPSRLFLRSLPLYHCTSTYAFFIQPELAQHLTVLEVGEQFRLRSGNLPRLKALELDVDSAAYFSKLHNPLTAVIIHVRAWTGSPLVNLPPTFPHLATLSINVSALLAPCIPGLLFPRHERTHVTVSLPSLADHALIARILLAFPHPCSWRILHEAPGAVYVDAIHDLHDRRLTLALDSHDDAVPLHPVARQLICPTPNVQHRPSNVVP